MASSPAAPLIASANNVPTTSLAERVRHAFGDEDPVRSDGPDAAAPQVVGSGGGGGVDSQRVPARPGVVVCGDGDAAGGLDHEAGDI
jgi:hypothetical protein